jgi:HD-GYP domain-containing protein (c-di-GMP phosphodiesterase class II)
MRQQDGNGGHPAQLFSLEMVETIQRLSLARDMGEVQEIVRHAARRLTGADGATFVLRDGDQCFYAEEDAIAPLWKGQRFPQDTCISGWVMRHGRPAVIEDIYADERIPHDAYRPTFVKSLAMVPIRRLDPLGAIGNYWATRHTADDHQLMLLQALADSTAVAIENITARQELEYARLEMLERLAVVAEYRDDATHQHAKRVARTSKLVAEALGVDDAAANLMALAAPLHDLGKLTLPEALLLKPARLTSAEFEIVKTHARAGAGILADSRSDVLQVARQIALTHHEWWDGTGYPDGLAGEAIPLSGRIVALADVFDALTHDRPYKSAWPAKAAVAEIQRLAGRQFDPAVVAAFRQLDHHALREMTAPATPAALLSTAA